MLLSYPEGVKRVLVDNSRSHRKGRGMQKTRALLGGGLLTSEGDFWPRRRRLAQPTFRREKLARMADGMAEVIREQVLTVLNNAACSRRPVDLAALMITVTLSTVSRALFGNGDRAAGSPGGGTGAAARPRPGYCPQSVAERPATASHTLGAPRPSGCGPGEGEHLRGGQCVDPLLYLMAYDHETPRLSLPAWASIGRR